MRQIKNLLGVFNSDDENLLWTRCKMILKTYCLMPEKFNFNPNLTEEDKSKVRKFIVEHFHEKGNPYNLSKEEALSNLFVLNMENFPNLSWRDIKYLSIQKLNEIQMENPDFLLDRLNNEKF